MHRKSSSKVRISDRTVLHPADRKSEVIDYLKLASASTSSSEVSIHPDKIKVNDIKEALEKAQEGVVKCTEHFKNLEEIKINARAYEQSQDELTQAQQELENAEKIMNFHLRTTAKELLKKGQKDSYDHLFQDTRRLTYGDLQVDRDKLYKKIAYIKKNGFILKEGIEEGIVDLEFKEMYIDAKKDIVEKELEKLEKSLKIK